MLGKAIMFMPFNCAIMEGMPEWSLTLDGYYGSSSWTGFHLCTPDIFTQGLLLDSNGAVLFSISGLDDILFLVNLFGHSWIDRS